jgi:hypothetical protein
MLLIAHQKSTKCQFNKYTQNIWSHNRKKCTYILKEKGVNIDNK